MDLFHMKRYWSEEEVEKSDEKEVKEQEEEVVKKLQERLTRKRKKTEQEEVDELPAADDKKEDQRGRLEEDTPKTKKKKKQNRKRSNESSSFSSQSDFTILGSDSSHQQRGRKIRCVLPEWLLNPDVVSADLKEGKVEVGQMEGLDEDLNERLRNRGVTHFFPVQRQVIPHLLDNCSFRLFRPSDICVSAPTGSGKTLAFILPLIQALRHRVVPRVRALVVLPVQDLAQQVHRVFQAYAEGTGLRVKLMSVARSFAQEQSDLVRRGVVGYHSMADIVVCTPGRLVDHIRRTEGFSLRHLRYLIVDEADRVMADIVQNDWMTPVEEAVYSGERRRPGPLCAASLTERGQVPLQKLLFSATLSQNPEQLEQLRLFEPRLFTSVVKRKDIIKGHREEPARKEKEDNEEKEFVGQYATPSELKEYFVVCRDSLKKPQVLHHLMTTRKMRRALIFTKSLEHTHSLAVLLRQYGLKVGELSSQVQGRRHKWLMNQLSSGSLSALVCSDVLARGIDMEVDYIVSYDCPSDVKAYVHRVGRTARAGKEGSAITICEEGKDRGRLAKIFREMGRQVGEESVEEIAVEEEELDAELYERAAKAAADVLKEEKRKKKRRGKRVTNC